MRISDWSSDVCSSDLNIDTRTSISPKPSILLSILLALLSRNRRSSHRVNADYSLIATFEIRNRIGETHGCTGSNTIQPSLPVEYDFTRSRRQTCIPVEPRKDPDQLTIIERGIDICIRP